MYVMLHIWSIIAAPSTLNCDHTHDPHLSTVSSMVYLNIYAERLLSFKNNRNGSRMDGNFMIHKRALKTLHQNPMPVCLA